MYLKRTQQKRHQSQWLFLSKRLKRLTEQGKFERLTEQKKTYLIGRLKVLFQKMLRFRKGHRLIKTLGAAALLLGLQTAPTLQAQVEFAPKVDNPFGLTHNGQINFSTLVDIDGDGDLDIISARYGEEEEEDIRVFTFIENDSNNDGTEPNFLNPSFNYADVNLSDIGFSGIANPTFADIDHDGDLDMFFGAYDDDTVYESHVVYYENIGDINNPIFGEPQTDPFNIDLGLSYIAIIKLADIDGDGDFDLFNTFYTYDEKTEIEEVKIDFIENIGTIEAPDFGSIQSAPFGLPNDFNDYRVYDIGDLDNDGDLDMITGGFYDYYNPLAGIPFTFIENIGDVNNPQFAEPVINPFSLENQLALLLWPYLGDLDNDGDLDILTESGYEYDTEAATWTFHENLLDPVATVEPTLAASATIFPTISRDFITINIEAKATQAYFDINVFDVDGKHLSSNRFKGGSLLNEQINLSNYPSGQYVIQVRTPEDVLVQKVIKQ